MFRISVRHFSRSFKSGSKNIQAAEKEFIFSEIRPIEDRRKTNSTEF